MRERGHPERVIFGLAAAAAAIGFAARLDAAESISRFQAESIDCASTVFYESDCHADETVQKFNPSSVIAVAIGGSALAYSSSHLRGSSRRARIFQPVHNGWRR